MRRLNVGTRWPSLQWISRPRGLLGLPVVLGLLGLVNATRAEAATCPDLVTAHLEHARDPLLMLIDLDRMRGRAERATRLNGQFFPPRVEGWRVAGGMALGTQFIVGARDCRGERDGEVQPSLAHLGFSTEAAYVPLDLALRVFGTGRMDSVLLTETDPGDNQSQLGYLRGLLGVGLRLTSWFEVAYAQLGDRAIRGDDPDWRSKIPLAGSPDPAHLLELGIPRVGLRVQLTDHGETLGPRSVNMAGVPLALGFHAAFASRLLPVEPGWLVAPKLLYRHAEGPESRLDFGLEVGLGTDEGALRHLRGSVEHLLLANDPGRGGAPRLGVRLEQRAELSVHRGPRVRAQSDAAAAIGGGWQMLAGLQTPYAHIFFDFGLSFNAIEMLDVLPVAVNRGMVHLGLQVETRWALGGG